MPAIIATKDGKTNGSIIVLLCIVTTMRHTEFTGFQPHYATISATMLIL
jgi:hypothetical protein